MLLNCGVGEGFWESCGHQGDQTSQYSRKSTLNIHWKNWRWSWSYNTLATWCEEPTHWKRPWCWERLKAGGEGGDRGWDSWMASPTPWTWIWMNSGRSWRTEEPGVLQSLRSQRVRPDLATFPANTFPGDGLYFECNACIMEKSPAFESERHRTDAHLCHCLAGWPQGIFNFSETLFPHLSSFPGKTEPIWLPFSVWERGRIQLREAIPIIMHIIVTVVSKGGDKSKRC